MEPGGVVAQAGHWLGAGGLLGLERTGRDRGQPEKDTKSFHVELPWTAWGAVGGDGGGGKRRRREGERESGALCWYAGGLGASLADGWTERRMGAHLLGRPAAGLWRMSR